jgi:hypothetical protein
MMARPLFEETSLRHSSTREGLGVLGRDERVVLEATVNTWAIADLLHIHAGRVGRI